MRIIQLNDSKKPSTPGVIPVQQSYDFSDYDPSLKPIFANDEIIKTGFKELDKLYKQINATSWGRFRNVDDALRSLIPFFQRLDERGNEWGNERIEGLRSKLRQLLKEKDITVKDPIVKKMLHIPLHPSFRLPTFTDPLKCPHKPPKTIKKPTVHFNASYLGTISNDTNARDVCDPRIIDFFHVTIQSYVKQCYHQSVIMDILLYFVDIASYIASYTASYTESPTSILSIVEKWGRFEKRKESPYYWFIDKFSLGSRTSSPLQMSVATPTDDLREFVGFLQTGYLNTSDPNEKIKKIMELNAQKLDELFQDFKNPPVVLPVVSPVVSPVVVIGLGVLLLL